MLLNHELDETNRKLIECRKRIAKLVSLHDDDRARLSHQQSRIIGLEAQVKLYREKRITATAHDVAGARAAIYQYANTGV